MDAMKNAGSAGVAAEIADAVHENAAWLSGIDGETGDGDHGVNMNKGFLMAKDRLEEDMSFSDGLRTIGNTLLDEIGGSMGPIYGTFFRKAAKRLKNEEYITKENLEEALGSALDGLCDLAGAKPGDKTLIDTLDPALAAYRKELSAGGGFAVCLAALSDGAAEGLENTRGMIAKVGRASRLGERSRGHLDAGAASCCVILQTMAKGIAARIG